MSGDDTWAQSFSKHKRALGEIPGTPNLGKLVRSLQADVEEYIREANLLSDEIDKMLRSFSSISLPERESESLKRWIRKVKRRNAKTWEELDEQCDHFDSLLGQIKAGKAILLEELITCVKNIELDTDTIGLRSYEVKLATDEWNSTNPNLLIYS